MLAAALWVGSANAANPAGYEERHIIRALMGLGLVPDPAPDGKTVAWVRTVRYEVFLPEEPFFTWPNVLHAVTDEDVVRREVLLSPGQPFDRQRAEESARNLRGLAIFALVRVVPVGTGSPGQVGLVVVTRDLWSLRLESEFQYTAGHLDHLKLQLTERNMFGRAKRGSARVDLQSLTVRPGAVYVDRRLLGEDLYLLASGDAILLREDGSPDGFESQLTVARPFYDLAQRWGFAVPITVARETTRQNQAGTILTYDPDPEDDDAVAIPRVWDQTYASIEGVAQLQSGTRYVQRFSVGWGFTLLDAKADVAEAYRADFERDVLPHTFRWVYPIAGWGLFENRYQVFRDLAAFAISEDVQLGPSTELTLRAPLAAFGSDENNVQVSGNVGWTEAFLGDGLVELAAGARGRWDADLGELFDETLLVRARAATPGSKAGRLVLRADWLARRHDTQGALTTLGGDNGLRGYGSQALFAFGASRVRGNVELRTAPVAVSFLHAGLATFYDVGTVYDDFDDAQLFQAVGLGLRALIPQFNSVTYRVDLGVPVDGSGLSVSFSVETGQAVPLTRREDRNYEFSVGGLSNQP